MSKKKSTKRKSKTTVKKRIAKQQKEFLEIIEKTPIVSYAIKRVGISKATYHRWRNEDVEFDLDVMNAIYRGSETINDLAESKLISLIQEGNLKAITFWLQHHKPNYRDRRYIEPQPEPRQIDKKSKEAVDNLFTLFENVARRVEDQYINPDEIDESAVIIDD
jgi:hypothetical protein